MNYVDIVTKKLVFAILYSRNLTQKSGIAEISSLVK